MTTLTVQMRMNEIGNEVRVYTRIAHDPNGEYIIYVNEGGTEVPFTSFSPNQVGHAVHLNGDNSKQEFYYLGGCPDGGLKLSGPHELLMAILHGTMPVTE